MEAEGWPRVLPHTELQRGFPLPFALAFPTHSPPSSRPKSESRGREGRHTDPRWPLGLRRRRSLRIRAPASTPRSRRDALGTLPVGRSVWGEKGEEGTEGLPEVSACLPEWGSHATRGARRALWCEATARDTNGLPAPEGIASPPSCCYF